MKPDLVNESEIRKELKEIEDLLHTIEKYKSSNNVVSKQLQKKDRELNDKKRELLKKRDILENALKLAHGL